MAYKDKERQREAVKLATRRYRERLKGITSVTPNVIPVTPSTVIPPLPKLTEITEQPAKSGRRSVVSQSYNPMMVGYVPPTGKE